MQNGLTLPLDTSLRALKRALHQAKSSRITEQNYQIIADCSRASSFFCTSILKVQNRKPCRFSRARVGAHVPTAIVFFCCHKCHTEGKFGRKGGENKVGSATKRKKENRVFQGCDTEILRVYIDRSLKIAQRNRITTCFQVIYK